MKEDSIEYYIIETEKNTYYVSIITKYDYNDKVISYGHNFGGTMKGCVNITVEVPREINDERFKFLEDSKYIAFISEIGYNRKCNIHNNLPKGQGTNDMVNTAMTFICERYPWIKSFTLNDNSYFYCKENKKVIDLTHISILTNGKTYYEKYYNARIFTEITNKFYLEKINELKDINKKMSWKLFYQEYSGIIKK